MRTRGQEHCGSSDGAQPESDDGYGGSDPSCGSIAGLTAVIRLIMMVMVMVMAMAMVIMVMMVVMVMVTDWRLLFSVGVSKDYINDMTVRKKRGTFEYYSTT